MIQRLILAPTILATLLLSSHVIAHPGHSHGKSGTSASSGRTWMERSGTFSVQGSFVSIKEGLVQIRRPDDSLVNLKLSQLVDADQQWIARRVDEIRQIRESTSDISNRSQIQFVSDWEEQNNHELLAMKKLQMLLAQTDRKKPRADATKSPDMARTFEAFVKKKAIQTRWDDRFFYVESNGIPDHQMMVGITSWQQQVPLPQSYSGENAWRIPLKPVPAKNPQSTKDNFRRGAIALAANGIPIFNPLNNRGDDAFLFGELDEFGGHCGRADDYHYHLPPVHLEKTIGKGIPIAYALDGYPIYGFAEPDGSKVTDLDEFNGHEDANGNYHYHATKTYPYLNGGFHGEVTERGGQVDPQPRAEPLRPDLRPLRDAKITNFESIKPGNFRLTYDVNGKPGTVSYTVLQDGSAKFVFVDTRGETTSETYSPRGRGPGGDNRRPPRRPF